MHIHVTRSFVCTDVYTCMSVHAHIKRSYTRGRGALYIKRIISWLAAQPEIVCRGREQRSSIVTPTLQTGQKQEELSSQDRQVTVWTCMGARLICTCSTKHMECFRPNNRLTPVKKDRNWRN